MTKEIKASRARAIAARRTEEPEMKQSPLWCQTAKPPPLRQNRHPPILDHNRALFAGSLNS